MCTRICAHVYATFTLQGELVAGLTNGVMAVPQTALFASMAGFQAAFGLYGCFAPVCTYAHFGGCRHLVHTIHQFHAAPAVSMTMHSAHNPVCPSLSVVARPFLRVGQRGKLEICVER